MNWLKRKYLLFKYRNYTQTELYELNEMLLKFGRRVTHDLEHLASEARFQNLRLERVGLEPQTYILDRIHKKLDLWRRVFYFDHGGKNYRSSIHRENDKLNKEVDRLTKLCITNNIDPTDPNEIPF